MSDWWDNMPWRMIQTNLREIDTLDIDADRFVADLKEFKANVVMINAAGIIASYPTRLPFHFQSPYLKGDSLKKILSLSNSTIVFCNAFVLSKSLFDCMTPSRTFNAVFSIFRPIVYFSDLGNLFKTACSHLINSYVL